MNDTDEPRHGLHETTYLAMVGEQFDGLSPGRRAELLAVVAENLDERPPAPNWDALLADLGTPATYAAQLVDGPIRRARRTPQQRLTRRRRWLASSVAAAAAAAVIAGPLRHTIDRPPKPELSTNCWGLRSDDPRFTFERLEAAGALEYRMDHLDGAEFRIPVCLSSSQAIDVVDVRIFDDYVEHPEALDPADPRSMPWTYPFRPVGVVPGIDDQGPRTPPTADSPVKVGPDSGLSLYLGMQFGTCEVNEGSVTGVSRVNVTYRYDGEEITEKVDLGALYSVRDVGSCTHEP